MSLVATPAGAAPCGDQATQTDLDQCAGAEFKQADDALDAAYKKVMERLKDDGPGQHLLAEAEAAWVAYRDKECTFASSASLGGSVYPMVVATCRTRLSRLRTKALDAYLDCGEGDLACPLPPTK